MILRRTLLLFLVTSFALQASAYIKYRYQVEGRLSSEARKNLNLSLKEYRTDINKKNKHLRTGAKEYTLRTTIKEAIEPFGYFNSKINIREKTTKSNTVIIATITPGQLTKITSKKIVILGEGSKDKAFQYAVKETKLKKGKVLHTQDFVNLSELLTSISMRKGYFDAQYKKKEIHINKLTNSAEITIIYNSHNRYRFGKTNIKAPYFNKGLLKKYFKYKEGQKYNIKALEETQQLLINSGYFSQAIITPDLKESHNGVTPINADLIAGVRKKYKVGIGYGSDTGPRITAKVTDNYISKNGHTIYSSIQLSRPNKNLTIGYTIPGALPDREKYKIAAGYTDIEQTSGHSQGKKISAIYEFNKKKLKRYFSINALNENYDLKNPDVQARSEMIYFSTGISLVNADDTLNPSNGYKIKAEVNGTFNQLSNEDGFSQLILTSNYMRTFNKKKTRLIIRTELGETNIKNLINLPLSLQLYIGGINSVRGYKFNSIGPGKYSYTASIEIQQKIYDQFYGSLYYDEGNIAQNENLFKDSYIGEGIGIGYLSIIGMIQINYTHAMSLKNKPYVLQLSLGSSL